MRRRATFERSTSSITSATLRDGLHAFAQPRMTMFDVDLMRDLLFELETRQASPRATVFVSIDEMAIAFRRTRLDIEFSLTGLLDLDYVEGPGMDGGFFLFRKLTRKGNEFLRATRRPRDWDRMKQHFAVRRAEGDG